MTASIVVGDAGRVVLPKAIRERLHLRKGTRLKADIVGDKIELSAEPDAGVRIERRGKRLVIVGGAPFDAVAAIKADREELRLPLVPYSAASVIARRVRGE